MKIFKKSLKYIYFLPKCTEYHEKGEKLAGLGSVNCTKTRPRGKTKTKYFEAILSKPYTNSFLNAQENTKSAITWWKIVGSC